MNKKIIVFLKMSFIGVITFVIDLLIQGSIDYFKIKKIKENKTKVEVVERVGTESWSLEYKHTETKAYPTGRIILHWGEYSYTFKVRNKKDFESILYLQNGYSKKEVDEQLSESIKEIKRLIKIKKYMDKFKKY